MLKDWTDKVNGYGVLFRFITPLLGILMTIIGTLALSQLNDIKESQRQVRKDLITYQVETRTYNTNHLAHHALQENRIAEVLSEIRAKQEIVLKKLEMR